MWVMVFKEQDESNVYETLLSSWCFCFFHMFPKKKSIFFKLLLLLTFRCLQPVGYATRWREWVSDIAWGQVAQKAQRWSWWWGWGAAGRQSSRRYYWGCVTSHNPWLHKDESTGKRSEIRAELWKVIHVSKCKSALKFLWYGKSWDIRSGCYRMYSLMLWQRCTLELKYGPFLQLQAFVNETKLKKKNK